MKYFALKKIILIGASTGGPGQIEKIIDALPKLHNTTLIIAQHMLEGFIDSFASRLTRNSKNPISVIQHNQPLECANIYLCKGKTQINTDVLSLKFSYEGVASNSFNPDINILFHSFVPLCKDIKILSIILTGIGDDGVKACATLSLNGARCITETQESAIVDGMPSQARKLVQNVEIFDMSKIIKSIKEFC